MGAVVRFLNDPPAHSGRSEPSPLSPVAAEGLVSLAEVRGELLRARGEACARAEAVVVTAFDRQLGRPAARAYGEAAPIFVAEVAGRPAAWVYEGGRACPEAAEDSDGD
jgi:hypothetical protein